MSNGKDKFRDRLVKAERVTPSLREHYNREVRNMFEKKLTPLHKWGMAALVALMLGQAGVFGYAFFAASELPALGRMSFALGVAFALAFAALLIRAIRRGGYNAKTDANAMTGLVWVFIILMITIFMLLAGQMEDTLRGIQMVLNGMVFLIIFGVVGFLQNSINQTHLKTQEKLLEIEYRLAEIGELLSKKTM